MRVVIATDGSDLAIEAGRRALAIAAPGTEFVLVAVAAVDTSEDTGAGGIEGPDVTPEELDRMRAESEVEGEAALTRTASELGLVGVREELVDGDPAKAICAFADRVDADLLVVGSHGRGPVRRALLGSVSDAIVHHAPCPVLVVRSRGV